MAIFKAINVPSIQLCSRKVERMSAISVSYRASGLANFLASEAACDKKRLAHLRPSRLRQATKRRSNPVALGQRNVVEVQGTYDWHAVIRRQDHLRSQSTNRSRHWRNDHFVQVFQYFVSREDQIWATLIR